MCLGVRAAVGMIFFYISSKRSGPVWFHGAKTGWLVEEIEPGPSTHSEINLFSVQSHCGETSFLPELSRLHLEAAQS